LSWPRSSFQQENACVFSDCNRAHTLARQKLEKTTADNIEELGSNREGFISVAAKDEDIAVPDVRFEKPVLLGRCLEKSCVPRYQLASASITGF
jgi:hypothetical protein